jgi:hypothetical protein
MPPAGRSARRSAVRRAVLGLAAAWLLAACGAGPEPAPPTGIDELQIPTASPDPTDFVAEIDNPYLPLVPGSRWVYEGESDGEAERIEVVVTDDRRVISGIVATVVRDSVFVEGELVEDTYDWYAQDAQGNVWYLGEDTKEYEDGKVTTTAGSWQAGVDGAQPGILLPGRPSRGMAYRQEYYKGEAEDKAAIITIGEERVQVPLGYFDKDVLMTRDLVPTEPKVQELKFYAPNVGPLLSMHTDGDGSRAELISYSRDG